MVAGQRILAYLAIAASGVFAVSAWAQQQIVVVAAPWATATVAGQTSGAAYMELTAAEDAALVGVASPLAAVAEVHEMVMDNGVMKMRARPRLDLPAGKPFALRPGSYHIMLMELKQPLRKGAVLPLTLKVEGRDGKTRLIEVNVEVRSLGDSGSAGSSSAASSEHMHHHMH